MDKATNYFRIIAQIIVAIIGVLITSLVLRVGYYIPVNPIKDSLLSGLTLSCTILLILYLQGKRITLLRAAFFLLAMPVLLFGFVYHGLIYLFGYFYFLAWGLCIFIQIIMLAKIFQLKILLYAYFMPVVAIIGAILGSMDKTLMITSVVWAFASISSTFGLSTKSKS
jgi:hypothetical protein